MKIADNQALAAKKTYVQPQMTVSKVALDSHLMGVSTFGLSETGEDQSKARVMERAY